MQDLQKGYLVQGRKHFINVESFTSARHESEATHCVHCVTVSYTDSPDTANANSVTLWYKTQIS